MGTREDQFALPAQKGTVLTNCEPSIPNDCGSVRPADELQRMTKKDYFRIQVFVEGSKASTLTGSNGRRRCISGGRTVPGHCSARTKPSGEEAID
jgi:hypothetical protein